MNTKIPNKRGADDQDAWYKPRITGMAQHQSPQAAQACREARVVPAMVIRLTNARARASLALCYGKY